MTIAEKIKYYRKRARLTQKELGSLSGTSETTIKQYELEKRQPRIEQLRKIADALNLHLLDLIDDTMTMELYDIYDKAAFNYYNAIGYKLHYDNEQHLIICHNGYGYKVPDDIFLQIEDNLRLDAEKNIDNIIDQYKDTKFDL